MRESFREFESYKTRQQIGHILKEPSFYLTL